MSVCSSHVAASDELSACSTHVVATCVYVSLVVRLWMHVDCAQDVLFVWCPHVNHVNAHDRWVEIWSWHEGWFVVIRLQALIVQVLNSNWRPGIPGMPDHTI